MDKKKRNLNPKDHQVLIHQAVVVLVRRAIVLIIKTEIRKAIKLNQNLQTAKLKQKRKSEDRVLEIEVDLIQYQRVVGRIQDIGVGHIQDITIEDLHIILDQEEVDRRYHVTHIPESTKRNEIVLLVQMNRKVKNNVTDDNILVKYNLKG